MKRANDSEMNQNDKRNRSWYLPTTTTMSTSSDSNDSTQHTDSSINSNPSNASHSEAPTLATTSASSMPIFGLFGSNSNRNPYPMPFGSNFDNRMFGMPNNDLNMPLSSSMMQFPSTTSTSINALELNGQNQTSAAADSLKRSSSPLPMFSSNEATEVSEMMKEKNLATLQKAVKRLIGWLKDGQCNKSNNNQFLDLITCAHNQVWRLMSEKTETKERVFEERREISKTVSNISSQFSEIVRVLDTAHVKKVWDHFTKPQRKQLSTWKEDANQMKSFFSDEFDDCEDEEVTSTTLLNNNHQKSPESNDDDSDELEEEWEQLKSELADAQNQLEVENKKTDKLNKENEKKSQGHQKQQIELMENFKELDSTIAALKKFKVDTILSQTSNENKENTPLYTPQPNQKSQMVSSDKARNIDGVQVNCNEVGLVTLISVFLYVHPFGASIDYICSYLAQVIPQASDTRYIESVLRKFPEVFKEKSSGVGATLVKVWVLLGFLDY